MVTDTFSVSPGEWMFFVSGDTPANKRLAEIERRVMEVRRKIKKARVKALEASYESFSVTA